MELRDLEYLQTILATGSVVEAARQVGRTAPALTKAMRRLEEETGIALFRRVGRRIEPTEAALFLAQRTSDMAGRLAVIRRQLPEVAAGRHGHVRLGVAATMAAIFLPDFLRRLSARHPDLTVSVINGMNNVLRAALAAGEVDIVLGVVDRTELPEAEHLVLLEDRVQVAASSAHRLQGHCPSFEELLAERWVLPARQVAMRQWFDAAFMAAGRRPPEPHVEASTIVILEDLIAGTDHLSFISGLRLELPHLDGRLRPLDVPELVMHRQMGATWLPGAAAEKALVLVIEELLRGAGTPARPRTA